MGRIAKLSSFFLIPLVNFIKGGVKWEKNPNNPNRNREETPTVEVQALLAERNSPMSVTSDSSRLHDAMAEAASR